MALLDDLKKKATKELEKQVKGKGGKKSKGSKKIEKMAKKELRKRFKI